MTEPTPAEKPDAESENDKLARNMRIAAYELPLILEAAAAALSAAPGERVTLRIEQCESFGKHCLDIRVRDKWVHLHTDYYVVVEKMKTTIESAFASPPLPADLVDCEQCGGWHEREPAADQREEVERLKHELMLKQGERNEVADELADARAHIAELEGQRDEYREGYQRSPVDAQGCPGCDYRDGVFHGPCALHKQIAALESALADAQRQGEAAGKHLSWAIGVLGDVFTEAEGELWLNGKRHNGMKFTLDNTRKFAAALSAPSPSEGKPAPPPRPPMLIAAHPETGQPAWFTHDVYMERATWVYGVSNWSASRDLKCVDREESDGEAIRLYDADLAAGGGT